MKISIQNAIKLSLATPSVAHYYVGSPGVGKTYAPHSTFKKAGYTSLLVSCQNIPAEDLAALPIINEDKTVTFATPEMWKPRPKMAIILDELFKAPEEVVNAFLPLVYGSPRTFMGFTYPEDLIVVITGNSAEFRVGDKEKPHMGNRMCRLEIADPTQEEAIETLLNMKVDSRIISWVKAVPQAVVSFDAAAVKKPETELSHYLGYDPRYPMQKYTSMRALELVSKSMQTAPADLFQYAAAGIFGDKAANSLSMFLRELTEYVPLPDMVNSPTKAVIPASPFDKRMAALTAASGFDTDTWKPLLTYIRRMPEEIQHIFRLNACKKEVSMKLLASQPEWSKEVQKVIG
jgi:hypothetical protein